MRPAVEHAMRIGYFKRALRVPFSLFLENIWDDLQHTVLVISRCYGKDDCLTVRHWDIANINRNHRMPPCRETIVRKEELFISDVVILDDYKTLEYYFEDYEYRTAPEGCDTRQWAEEEQEEYRFLMEKLYFSVEHQMQRESILWHNFMNGFLNKSYNLHLKTASIDVQHCIVQEANPDLWKSWLLWRKYILDLPGAVAPELIFSEDYEKKISRNVKYQEMLFRETLRRKEEEESKWSQTVCANYNGDLGGCLTMTTHDYNA